MNLNAFFLERLIKCGHVVQFLLTQLQKSCLARLCTITIISKVNVFFFSHLEKALWLRLKRALVMVAFFSFYFFLM